MPSGKGFLAIKMSLIGAHASSSTECGHVFQKIETILKYLGKLNQYAEDDRVQRWKEPRSLKMSLRH